MLQWLVIVPPILLLLIAFFTHNILLSLLVGITSASLIAAQFSLTGAAYVLFEYCKRHVMGPDFFSLFGFLFVLGAIIALITHTGGSCAFSNILTKRIKSARASESTSLSLSLLLCVDDYLNSLTMGCLMRPLTDKFKVPRAKLAYLIDVMASPLAVLVPVSSWIAFIVKQLKDSGVRIGFTKYVQHQFDFPGGMFRIGHDVLVQADPFYTYVKSIPFIFYSFIVILTAWFVVRRRISYGPMAEQERIAKETGNLYGGKEPRFKFTHEEPRTDKTYLSDFLVPILSLIICTLITIPYSGGYYLFGGTYTLLESLRKVDIFPVLLFASVFSFSISCILALIRKKIKIQHIPLFIARGIHLMYPSVIIVFCALVFSSLLDDKLHTGTYIAYLILPYINLHLLPFIIFVLTSLVAMGTGSSWGTIAIMIPISIPMLSTLSALPGPIPLKDIYILLPTIGAVISGSLAGAQLSPISDPVTMASTSSGAYQIDHVKTQFWYLVPVIIGTSISFIVAGYLPVNGTTLNGFVCMTIGLTISIGLTYLFNLLYKKRSPETE